MAEEDVAEDVSGVNVDLIGDGIGVFVAEYSILARDITEENSMPAAGGTAVRHPRIASKKNLRSVQSKILFWKKQNSWLALRHKSSWSCLTR